MGVRILTGKEGGSVIDIAAMFCSTTELAFGPLFREESDLQEPDGNGLDAHQVCQRFIEWLPQDARRYDAVTDWDSLRFDFLTLLRSGKPTTHRGPYNEDLRRLREKIEQAR